jgi:hypothetical protein
MGHTIYIIPAIVSQGIYDYNAFAIFFVTATSKLQTPVQVGCLYYCGFTGPEASNWCISSF